MGHPSEPPPRPSRRTPVSVATPAILVEPPRRWELPRLSELWEYRELLYFLAWRDLKVRYRQTVIGAGWAVAQPLLLMVVFTLIFGELLEVPSEGAPYAVFAFAGLLPWNYFASALMQASGSLVYDANLVSKVYFPRLVSPLAATLPPVVDLGVALVVLLGLMFAFGTLPSLTLLALPLVLGLALLTAVAFGVWFAALNVKYRDVGYVVPFLIHVGFFTTPVVYPSSVIPEPWRVLYGLNPMVGVVEGFRWALLGSDALPSPAILLSVSVVLLVLTSGVLYFRRTEAEFADVV